MSDLFEKIMSDMPKEQHNSTNSVSNEQLTKSSSSHKASKEGASKDASVKAKDSSKKTKSSDNALDKLVDIMSTGFSDLQNLLLERQMNYEDQIEYDYEYDADDDIPVEVNDPKDLFVDMADDIKSGDSTGPEVKSSLASLTDMLLQKKVAESLFTEKRTVHLRPINVNFFEGTKN